jgi:2,3-bisphosphoglycerate-dependent phosphoglycerate mutase
VKRIYLVRHCKAAGQEPDAPLVDEGFKQAKHLADYLSEMAIEYLISSPFKRAVDSIRPLSERIGIPIEFDERLRERVLSSVSLDNWMDCLEQTYLDDDLKFEGGESSKEAAARGIQVIEELLRRPEHTGLIVTHGGLLSLIIRQFIMFGFDDWKNLTNPDVFLLTIVAGDPAAFSSEELLSRTLPGSPDGVKQSRATIQHVISITQRQ